MIILQLGLALAFGAAAIWLLVGSVFGMAVSICVLAFSLGEAWACVTQVTPSRIRAMAVRYRQFPLFRAPYSIMSQLSEKGVLMILPIFVSTSVVGSFALAQRVIFLPAASISGSLEQVFYSHAARLGRDVELERLIRRTVICSAYFFAPMFFFAFANMTALFGFVFGPQWTSSGEYGAWLALPGLTMLLTNWLTRVFDVFERQKLALIIQTLYNIVCFSGFGLVLFTSGSVRYAIVYFSIVTMLYSFVWLFVALEIAQFSKRSLYEAIIILAAIFIYCALVNWGASRFVESVLLRAVILSVACLPTMLTGALMLRRSTDAATEF